MSQALPPPLPPETRTVGQLVAETIRFYQAAFWTVLPLGLPIALLNVVGAHSYEVRALLLAAGAPFLTLAYVRATTLVTAAEPTRRSVAVALVAGVAVLLPAAALAGWFELLAVAWLAFAGFVVPVAIVERTALRDAFVRARRLATVDYVHALGGLATLTIVYALMRLGLVGLLRSQGDVAERIAGFLADLVLSPTLFVGAALLYGDQRARLDSPHAALHPPVDPVHPGRPDPEGEPRPAAGSQP